MATEDPIPTAPAVNPADLATSQDLYEVALIDVPAERMRTALDPDGIADLAKSIGREGQLQPIGLRETPKGFTLIWGDRRLAAIRSLGRHRVWAVVYSPDLTDQQAKQLEIVENLKRAELSPGERQAHVVDLLALVRETEEAETRITSDFSAGPKPTTGRGHKGAIAKTAELLDKDPKAVRQTLDRAAETIGEVIDQTAPAAKIKEQAKKVREKAPTVPRRRGVAGGSRRKVPAEPRPSRPAQPDISALICSLNVDWPMPAVRAYRPTAGQLSVLRVHLPDVRSKIEVLTGLLAEPEGAKDVKPGAPSIFDMPVSEAFDVEPAAPKRRAKQPRCAICGKAIRKDQMDVVHEGKPAHFACVQQPDKASH